MEENLPSREARSSNTKHNWHQFIAVFVVNLLRVSYYIGAAVEYSDSPLFDDASNDTSDYLEYMDVTYSVAGTLSYPLSAFMFQRLSRKTCAYIPSVGFIVTCIMNVCSRSVLWLHIAHASRAFSFAISNMMTVIYISEIVHDDIRGTLLLISDLMYNITHTVVFFIEEFHAFTFTWFVILPPAVVIVCFIFWLPETPIYFLRQGNKGAAKQSMMWLRGSDRPEEVSAELEKKDEMLITTGSDSSSTTPVFRELLSRRSLKYTGIVIVLYLTNHFSGMLGIHVLIATSHILHKIWHFGIVYHFVDFAKVLGNVIAIIICDRKGRRFALLISTSMCAIALIIISICVHLVQVTNTSIVEIFAIIFAIVYNVAFNIGLAVVITVVIADIFPPKLLNTQLALRGTFTLIVNMLEYRFMYRNMWNYTMSAWIFWLYAAVCAAGGVFIFKFLPETKRQPTGFLFMESRQDVLLSNIQNG